MFGSSKRTVLYYPTIDIPNEKWLRQAILYWDNVASIVPQDWEDKSLIPFSNEIEYLIDEKIYKPFNPSKFVRYMYNGYRDKFQQEFIEIINSPIYKKYIGPKEEWVLNSKIHEDKVSSAIIDYLIEKKLVRNKSIFEDGNTWYLFEKKTALLFMSLLARYISDIEKEYTVPSTDFNKFENLIFSPQKSDAGLVCTKALFQNILPVPREDVPIDKIIEFRTDYRKHLLRFRKRVSVFHNDVSKAKSENKIKEITTDFAEDIELGIIEITDGLIENKIKFGLDSLTTGIKSPTFITGLITVGTTIVAKIQGTDISFEVSLAAPTLVGIIEIGNHYVKSSLKKSALLNKSAFTYLYHARKLV